MAKQASTIFLRALAKLGQQFVKNNLAVSASCKVAKPSKPWAARQPSVQAKAFKQEQLKPRQNGRKMTSFVGAMAKLGAGVDNELGGLAPRQCR